MAFEDIKRDIDTVPGMKGSMAKWGAVGAVAGLILPGLGSVVGALGGAAYGFYRRKTRG